MMAFLFANDVLPLLNRKISCVQWSILLLNFRRYQSRALVPFQKKVCQLDEAAAYIQVDCDGSLFTDQFSF